jgi:hypothetical protein
MEMFGADGLRLRHGAKESVGSLAERSAGTDGHYIIRNAEVLEKPEGVNKSVLPFGKLIEKVRTTGSEGLRPLSFPQPHVSRLRRRRFVYPRPHGRFNLVVQGSAGRSRRR